jgi:Tol biopolymer transport system component
MVSRNCRAVIAWTIALAATAEAQVTERVSVGTGGTQGNFGADESSVSADGRYVAFASYASDLVAGDTNGEWDIFVRDRQSDTTELVSVSSSGEWANFYSRAPSISADGRYVAFQSSASNLVAGVTSGAHIYVRDRQLGTTEIVSLSSLGVPGNWTSMLPSISADGRYVSFGSGASNLVPNDVNGGGVDIFVRDRQNSTTELVSVSSAGVQADSQQSPDYNAISADGRYVAFASMASNLAHGDSNGTWDIFVRDRFLGTTERVSVSSSGVQGNDQSSYHHSVSADGRYVAFQSLASNLVPGDTNGSWDVFVRDRQSGTTERVSVSGAGAQANSWSVSPAISADGRFVAFDSIASNLVANDTNGNPDVFLRDLQSGTIERVDVTAGGAEGNFSKDAAVSPDGRFVTFWSYAALVPGDTNATKDVFLRDRDASSFTSLCSPGLDGVMPCPCVNPPAGSDRGCDNSAATGGAILSASGIAYLATDSLVFTASGELPTATSIVLQGNAESSAGTVFGQGVRCAGGALRRLYVKAASGGSITAPDFAAGEPSISARSAALGDLIQAGESRWYLVYYRDPVVLGGCSSSSTFNATQTGRVSWSL